MLPLCCSSSAFPFSSYTHGAGCSAQDLILKYTSLYCNHPRGASLKMQAAKPLDISLYGSLDEAGSIDSSIFSRYPDNLDDIVHEFSYEFGSQHDKWDPSFGENKQLYYIDNDINNSLRNTLSGLSNDKLNGDSVNETPNVVTGYASSPSEYVPGSGSPSFEASSSGGNGVSELRNIENFLSRSHESLDNLLKTFSSSTEETIKAVTGSLDNRVESFFGSAERAQQQASGMLAGLSDDFRDGIVKGGVIATDVLRKAIVSLEDSLSKIAMFVVYSYGSTKTMLPEEAQNTLYVTEERATQILNPVASALKQVFLTVEMLEKIAGLDPSDPLVPFIVFMGTSATLGISYWLIKYGGYSGDLSPELTMELLKNEKDAVLIDVRPEELREADGIPDLRRGARFKYASVTIPKIDGSAKRLLKNVKEIDDALFAVIIQNLKVVQDRSKVIIMDAYGEQSKGIARSLRKLGVKRCYLVNGGYKSWVKAGLRIKQLKAETTLTILNEEAEAILEEIKPTPTLAITYGMGALAVIYAILEWETTLQLIGIFGLGQSLYKRFSAYEDSEEFKEDIRFLLSPVSLGAQAFSWAAGKLEPAKVGLPTSPSSASVQDRVLQAAAKHESQPADSSEEQNQPPEPSSQGGDDLDVAEA